MNFMKFNLGWTLIELHNGKKFIGYDVILASIACFSVLLLGRLIFLMRFDVDSGSIENCSNLKSWRWKLEVN